MISVAHVVIYGFKVEIDKMNLKIKCDNSMIGSLLVV